MSRLFALRCAPDDVAGLHAEIERRNKIIRALMARAERALEGADSEFGLLHDTFALETQVRERTAELKRSVEELSAFVANAPVGVLRTRDQHIVRANAKFNEIFGFSGEAAIGLPNRSLFRSDAEFEQMGQIVMPVLATAQTFRTEAYMRHQNGSDLWINVIGYAFEPGIPVRSAMWMLEDRTAYKHAEDALRESYRTLAAQAAQLSQREAELSTVIENAYDAYVCVDDQGIVTAWNQRAEATFGWSPEEAIGRPLDTLFIPADLLATYHALRRRYRQSGPTPHIEQRLELPAVRRDGSRLTVEASIRALDFAGHTVFSAFLHDITERKAHEALREHEARYDLLTGLPNRRSLMELLQAALARQERRHAVIAVLFIDLDGFKAVNDQHGHQIGDALLREVAARLQAALRQTDTVARHGGDEFIVILEGLAAATDDARHCASTLIEAVSAPFVVAGHTLHVGASIGISHSAPGQHANPSELIRQADMAMYQAKHAGKGTVRVFAA